MPTFDTPGPITVTASLILADVHITASERADAVVDVRPGNNAARSARMAEQTRVEFADGRLRVHTPKQLRSWLGSNPGRLAVEIQVPAGSRLDGDSQMGDLIVDGDLGDCRYKTGYGEIRLGRTGRLRINTGSGDVTVDRVAGDAELTTGNGRLRVSHVDGTAVLKSSNGDTWIGEVTGAARVNTANGEIAVGRAVAGVTAKTANGQLRVGEAVSGQVVLQTAAGRIEIGIPTGTAAWLDLDAGHGTVRNTLDSSSGPVDSDRTVEVRAHTYYGDIVVHRA